MVGRVNIYHGALILPICPNVASIGSCYLRMLPHIKDSSTCYNWFNFIFDFCSGYGIYLRHKVFVLRQLSRFKMHEKHPCFIIIKNYFILLSFQQINAVIAASMSLKNSHKVRKIMEVSSFYKSSLMLHTNHLMYFAFSLLVIWYISYLFQGILFMFVHIYITDQSSIIHEMHTKYFPFSDLNWD